AGRNAVIDGPDGPVNHHEKDSSGEGTAEVVALNIGGGAVLQLVGPEKITVQGGNVVARNVVPIPARSAVATPNDGFVQAVRVVVILMGDGQSFFARQDRVGATIRDPCNRLTSVHMADALVVREPWRVVGR